MFTRPGVDKVKLNVWFKYSLQITNTAGLFHHVLIYMEDLYLFLFALVIMVDTLPHGAQAM